MVKLRMMEADEMKCLNKSGLYNPWRFYLFNFIRVLSIIRRTDTHLEIHDDKLGRKHVDLL